MADIAKCKNETCPFKKDCYRYTSAPSKYVQSYGDFKPKVTNGVYGCEFQMAIK